MPEIVPAAPATVEVTPEKELPAGQRANRLFFIDNIRWMIIILVVSMHAADTYSPIGSWYFVDRKPLSTGTLLFFAAWQMYLQSFFMGLLFFIAGFFVPPSFDRKGATRFLGDRAFRLGLPVLFYMFLLGPFTEYFVAHSWNSSRPTSFAKEWIKHIRNGQFLQENGPLWFCLALLIFSFCYTVLRGLNRRASLGSELWAMAPRTQALIVFAVIMATLTFLVRAERPPSWFNLPLRDFAQYVLLFSVGILASRNHWLPKLSYARGMHWLMLVIPIGFGLWLALLFYGGAFRGQGSFYSGGWHWQSAGFALWESLTSVAIGYGLLVWFREKYNQQGSLERFLSDNAFSVYVFHPPILITAARLLHNLAWPAILKFALLTAIAACGSFFLSALIFRRIPGLRRML
ncbi:MAG: acyltransferase family protein [Acidobacteria bacterium]|nr:acyltransferase family protein [Acidobacteriota bacterium]